MEVRKKIYTANRGYVIVVDSDYLGNTLKIGDIVYIENYMFRVDGIGSIPFHRYTELLLSPNKDLELVNEGSKIIVPIIHIDDNYDTRRE